MASAVLPVRSRPWGTSPLSVDLTVAQGHVIDAHLCFPLREVVDPF